jgi:hypothetical protein
MSTTVTVTGDRDAELLERYPICRLALPGCGVRSTVVVRLRHADGRKRIFAACERCAERSGEGP